MTNVRACASCGNESDCSYGLESRWYCSLACIYRGGQEEMRARALSACAVICANHAVIGNPSDKYDHETCMADAVQECIDAIRERKDNESAGGE